MEESASTSREISNAIQGMIINLQFQDRNTQITENSVEIIKQCLALCVVVQKKSGVFMKNNTGIQDMPAVRHAVESIISVIKLGDIRKKYGEKLKNAGIAHAIAAEKVGSDKATTDEDIELF